MKKPTTISKESVSEYREFVQLRLRKLVLEAIEVVLEEEVDQALGCGSYERAEDRRGYRNGAETRRVTTSVGTRELRVPRARVRDEETGETTEFRSELLPRYARRTREVEEAILGTYLSGTNSRRIRKALKPLLGEEHLSKSAVSRVVRACRRRCRRFGFPVRAGKTPSSNGMPRSRAETWIQARAAPGPERAGRLRHSSPGLDSGPLGRPLFRRCTALSATPSCAKTQPF